MLRHHAPKAIRIGSIISNVWFTMADTRYRPLKFVDTKGMLFFCCFGAGYFLVGFNGKLWRLNTDGYKTDWPTACIPNRLTAEILWIEMKRYENPFEFTGRCTLFEKKGKTDHEIYEGRLENLSHLLIRLQRWTRRVLHRVRVLALCMAFHPRLGGKSWLAELGEDILLLIIGTQFGRASTPAYGQVQAKLSDVKSA
jgi:hypothetical protein